MPFIWTVFYFYYMKNFQLYILYSSYLQNMCHCFIWPCNLLLSSPPIRACNLQTSSASCPDQNKKRSNATWKKTPPLGSVPTTWFPGPEPDNRPDVEYKLYTRCCLTPRFLYPAAKKWLNLNFRFFSSRFTTRFESIPRKYRNLDIPQSGISKESCKIRISAHVAKNTNYSPWRGRSSITRKVAIIASNRYKVGLNWPQICMKLQLALTSQKSVQFVTWFKAGKAMFSD